VSLSFSAPSFFLECRRRVRLWRKGGFGSSSSSSSSSSSYVTKKWRRFNAQKVAWKKRQFKKKMTP